MKHRVSASKVWDALECAYPMRGDVELVPDAGHPAARDGQAIDTLTTAWVRREPMTVEQACAQDNASPARVARLWAQLEPWLVANLTEPGWLAQLWMVYDPRRHATRLSSREASMRGDRKAHEISCVADLVLAGEDEAIVLDVKTGKPSNTHVEQLRALACATAAWAGVRWVSSGFVFVSEEGVQVERLAFGGEQIERFASTLEGLLLEVPDSGPTPGMVCRYCRAAACDEGERMRERMGWRKR